VFCSKIIRHLALIKRKGGILLNNKKKSVTAIQDQKIHAGILRFISLHLTGMTMNKLIAFNRCSLFVKVSLFIGEN